MSIRRLVPVVRRRPRSEGERGYTLVELAVAMAGLLVFMSFATPFLFSQLKQAVQTENRADLQQHARTAMRTLVRELRQAKDLYSSTDKPSGKNKLSFGADLDGSGTLSGVEQVTYYVKQGKLWRDAEEEIEKGQPIADDVNSIEFTMFGSNLLLDKSPTDGVVSETELDQNHDGNWSTFELSQVTRISVLLKVKASSDEQTYVENVWLRNRVVG